MITPDNGEYTVTITPGMTINVKNSIKKADLKISKVGADDAVDPNQSFIFNVEGPYNYKATVTVYGNNSVTLKDLPVGIYKVAEENEWSWRYDDTKYEEGELGGNLKASDKEVDLTTGSKEIKVTNTRNRFLWLDGYSYCKNIFLDDTVVKSPD